MLSYFLDSFCSLIDSFNIYVGYIIFFISSIIFIVLCVWLHSHRQEVLMWLFNFFIYLIIYIIFVYIMVASIFGRK